MNKQASDPEFELPAGFRVVEITRQPIELYKILKFEGLAGSGGEAKSAVAAGLIKLNGVVETQKRKQIVPGDRIEFGEDKIFITFNPVNAEIQTAKPVAKQVAKKKTATRKARPAISSGGRISNKPG